MSQGIKSGKRPLSSKNSDIILRDEDVFGNPLSLPPGLKAELAEKGLEARFIDSKKLYDNHGYHDKGWTPYKRSSQSSSATLDKSEFKSGSDPDGVFRRGSLILAVKPKEEVEKHRLLLKQKANRQKTYNKTTAAELRKLAREASANSEVYEGYDENDTD